MPIRPLVLCCLALAWTLLLFAPTASAQAGATAVRRADLQIGLGYVSDRSDYNPTRLNGGAFYTTLDISNHYGVEGNIHQANSPSGDGLYQRSYEIGPRYHRVYGPASPYVKAMIGRGIFNFPSTIGANLAYNLYAVGGGLDLAVLPFLNVRADYEYQIWKNFPPRGLRPQLITIGVAYHFPGGLKRGLHY